MKTQDACKKVLERKDLTAEVAQSVLREILHSDVPETLIGELLIALHRKGESVGEIVGFARQMRLEAVHLDSPQKLMLDTCGTGGDGLQTLNVSTLAALVVAGCGVTVAKHGNRSVSSRCGSADVLEALGVRLELPLEVIQRGLAEDGFAFLFAPVFHPAMKKLAALRRSLGTRTIFNILGPLCNPAGVQCQLIGVGDKTLARRMAEALRELECRRAIVVSGADGMDEVSLSGQTHVFTLLSDNIEESTFAPESISLPRATRESLQVADVGEGAATARAVLRGQSGTASNLVRLNAAFALMACGRAKDPAEGLALATESLDKGKAMAVLQKVVARTQGH